MSLGSGRCNVAVGGEQIMISYGVNGCVNFTDLETIKYVHLFTVSVMNQNPI